MGIMELAAMVGERRTLGLDGLQVAVTVLDVKKSYGQARALVTPVDGSGSVWVSVDRLGV
jgi:hypothetical protein